MSKTVRLTLWWNCSLQARPQQERSRLRARWPRWLASNGPRPRHGDEQDEETKERRWHGSDYNPIAVDGRAGRLRGTASGA